MSWVRWVADPTSLPCTAEYILWGDQNEPRIFDFFLENNILTYLHKVLLQPSNRTGEVAKQVGWQTLSSRQPHHSRGPPSNACQHDSLSNNHCRSLVTCKQQLMLPQRHLSRHPSPPHQHHHYGNCYWHPLCSAKRLPVVCPLKDIDCHMSAGPSNAEHHHPECAQ